jgi:4-amino-4-deoxy-L-arabinose transferase-like glycosyltransferase
MRLRDLTEGKAAWIAALLALFTRLAAALATGGLRHPELNEYDSIARSLVAGKGFQYVHIDVLYYSYAPPLCSWLSAASYWLMGSIAGYMLLQIAAGAGLAMATSHIATRLVRAPLAGLAAGALVAFHPGLVVYSATKAHPLTFDALFFTLALLQSFRLAQRQTVRRAIEFGLIIGVGTLSRSTIIIFLPLTALWLAVVVPNQSWPATIRSICIAGLCTAAIVAPWTIRNSLLHHRFVFLLTTDSEDFWRGNNPYASGGSYAGPNQLVLTSIPPAELQDLKNQPNELAQSDWFMVRAREFVRTHPGQFVRLTLTKFFQFWWFAPHSGVMYPGWWLYGYAVYYVMVLALAGIGVVAVINLDAWARQQALLLVVFVLALSGLQSLFYVEGRHRWAVEPMVMALSGAGVAQALRFRKLTS